MTRPLKPTKPLAKLNSLEAQIELLRELVDIPSGSRNVEGVQAVQEVVARELKRLDFDLEWIKNPVDPKSSASFLIGRSQLASAGGRTIDLIVHTDTVFEKESGFLYFIDIPGGKFAKGPGVIDDKGGIVVALRGIEEFCRTSNVDLPLRVIVSPSEEIGSPGFQTLFQKLSVESALALGFEPAFEDGSIIQARRGNRWYRLDVEGHAAHSGREPRKGINAAHALAHYVVEIAKLNDPSKDLTVSTGELKAGDLKGEGKFNVVAAYAKAKIDVRFSDFKTRDEAHQKIETILKTPTDLVHSDRGQAKVSSSLSDDCPPLEKDLMLGPWIERYQKILGDIENRPIQAVHSGGAADVNYMSRPGLLAIDGLGPYGSGMHTKDEKIELKSLETRAWALARFLGELAESEFSKSFSKASN